MKSSVFLSGTSQKDAVASIATSMSPQKTRAGLERKARKTGTLLKKKAPGRTGKASRIEASSARLLVSAEEPRQASSGGADSSRKEKSSLLDSSVFGTAMDVDEPLNTPPPPSDSEAVPQPASRSTAATSALSDSTPGPSSAFAVPEPTLASNQDRTGPSSSPALADSLPHASVSAATVTPQSGCSTSTSSTAPVASAMSASTSAATAPPPPSSASPPASSSSSSNQTSPSKAAADPNIVSLKIIISENQEESPSDPTLTQAISSIAKDKIPTIYISSPAKSPGGSSAPAVNMDEAAQAVSGLQNSEVPASPLCSKAQALVASPLTGTSQVQQNYIFQLPLDTAAPAVQGATASYILLAEPPAAEPQTRPVLLPKGQPLATGQFGLPTAGQPQGYAAGKRELRKSLRT